MRRWMRLLTHTDDVETDIQGYDIDGSVIKVARRNAREAGVDHLIHFQERDVRDLSHPKKSRLHHHQSALRGEAGGQEGSPGSVPGLWESFRRLDSWSAI